MHASPKFSLRSLLSPPVIAVGVIAALLAAPSAFAKKDLFATEPGAKYTPPAEQLVPASSTAPETFKANDKAQAETTKPSEAAGNATQIPIAEAKIESSAMQKELVAPREPSKEPSANKELSATKNSSSSKDSSKANDEPSALEVQMARLKRNLTKTKNDLFGSKSSSEKKAASPAEPQLTESTSVEEESKPAVATISTTEAAQRAQTFAEGQVINVRKYLEDDKPRYAVKLLQKNGRMKTINLDAVNGALIEETPQ